MIPTKLKEGDEIRILSPAESMSQFPKKFIDDSKEKLERLGFEVTFSKNIKEIDEFNSTSIKSRVDDIHEAFSDKNVKAIIATVGGFNSNQLLRHLNYKLIKNNPKILCGYSDITALQNTIYKKTGLVTYSGPEFMTFGMLKGIDYILKYFKKCLMEEKPLYVTPSKTWSDDKWWKNQEKRNFIKNKGTFAINRGKVEGIIIGGNLCTLNLLQGTEFMPSLKGSILFIEDNYESKLHHFDRDLQSLIHLPDFKYVKGIVIGRFQKESKAEKELIIKMIKTKKELNKIPIIADADFGHTYPMMTFPIGGRARIDNNKIEIIKH